MYNKQHNGPNRRTTNGGELAGVVIITKGYYTWQKHKSGWSMGPRCTIIKDA